MGIGSLQWGRVRVNAESIAASAARRVLPPLQWGRVRVNAERLSDDELIETILPASMGPRSCERGKRRRAIATCRPANGFNGAAFV